MPKQMMAGLALKNGHSVLFSDMPNPAVRPGYDMVMPYLLGKVWGKTR